MNDKEHFQATTQRHLTYLLIYGLFILVGALLIGAYLPFPVNDKLLALAGPIITGIFGLASGAIGFWIAKQRYQGGPDEDMVIQSHVSPDGSKTTVTSPSNTPPANLPTLSNTAAPAAPLSQSPEKIL